MKNIIGKQELYICLMALIVVIPNIAGYIIDKMKWYTIVYKHNPSDLTEPLVVKTYPGAFPFVVLYSLIAVCLIVMIAIYVSKPKESKA